MAFSRTLALLGLLAGASLSFSSVAYAWDFILEDTKIPEYNSWFEKASEANDVLNSSRGYITTPASNLKANFELPDEVTFEDALEVLKQAGGEDLSVSLQGGEIVFEATPTAPDRIQRVSKSLTKIYKDLSIATQKLTAASVMLGEMIAESDDLVKGVPDKAKSAGLKPRDYPTSTKAVKNNLGELTKLKEEIDALISNLGQLRDGVIDAFNLKE